MNFWIFAIALLVISAIVISWPLFNGTAKDKVSAIFILLIMPLAVLLMYQNIGTPEALNQPSAAVQQAQQQAQQQDPHASQQGQMDDLVISLKERLANNPDDAQGWLILGRSLKTMQRYAESEEALANANRLIPDNPLIMVELAETRLFLSGQAQIGADVRQLLESALDIDPTMQKGLWLMGMAYSQDGDDAHAVAYWQKLLDQLDPTSGAAASVTQQIQTAQARMAETGDQPVTLEADPVQMPEAEPAVAVEPVTRPVAEGGIPVNVTTWCSGSR
jgi:cytochrome c-type biogenesis protein CcmH